ncbi:MAG: hypothetical protein RLZZ488_1139 [Pseudomonadota bacterium]|jgi:hypothetical protein
MKLIALLACFTSATAAAVCPAVQDETEKVAMDSEIALANMVIYSQEYMRYLFADNESAVQPLPASGISLFLARELRSELRATAIFTLPLRDEEVKRKNAPTQTYYYPKLAMLGIERDIFATTATSKEACIRVSAGGGLALPMSPLIKIYQPPYLLIRAGAEVGENVFLNFGLGYSGNIKRGAWFFPFGISYVLSNPK